MELTETPIPIQISGGEHSIREDLPEIVELAKQIGYRNIELITNGIRISKEDSLAFFGNEPRNKILATFVGKKEFFFRHQFNKEGSISKTPKVSFTESATRSLR